MSWNDTYYLAIGTYNEYLMGACELFKVKNSTDVDFMERLQPNTLIRVKGIGMLRIRLRMCDPYISTGRRDIMYLCDEVSA